MTFIDFILLAMVVTVFYGYIGYPILLAALCRRKKTIDSKSEVYLPTLTHIIAAYNEEKTIYDKVKNALSLSYPENKLQIIVVTDGSDDNTEKIARSAGSDRVLVLHSDKREGKSAAVNRAVAYSTGDILVFSDADTKLNCEAMENLAQHFSDDSVGCVAGEKRVALPESSSEVAGEGLYWKYESKLKRLDSCFYTTLGAAGELFAIRKELFRTDRSDFIIEDFVTSMSILRSGYRIAYEPEAYALERPTFSLHEEYKRRVRIFAGAFQAMVELRSFLNPFRYPKLSFQYFSHRVLRWAIIPALFPLILLMSIISVSSGSFIGAAFLTIEACFIFSALLGIVLYNKGIQIKILWYPFYFIYLNLLPWVGLKRYLLSEQTTLWEKPVRQGGLL